MSDIIDHCQTVDGVFIPGCMGSAVYGRYGCTCPTEMRGKKTRQGLEQRIIRIEKRLAELEKILCQE